MAKVGVARAVKLTGKSKSTIQRAMNDGKMSFHTSDKGTRIIDVSELERVFGLDEQVAEKAAKKPSKGMANVAELERIQLRAKSLEDQMYLLSEQLDDVKAQREDWKKQAQQLAITHQTTQDQAQGFKTQADEARAQIDEAQKRADAEKQAANEAKVKADQAERDLENLRQTAHKMKQKILQQQKEVADAKKPKGLLGLLGLGGK